jgi:phosphoribosylformylglycinamidine synthase
VDPTPTIGMVGLLERVEQRVPSHFRRPGDAIVILGETRGELGGSAYWAELLDFVGGRTPPVDLAAERRLQRLLVSAAGRGLLRSAHDCSEGGLLVALAEAAIGGPYAPAALGARVDLTGYAEGLAPEALLYGEDAGRVVVSCAAESVDELLGLAGERGVPAFPAGTVGDEGGTMELRAGTRVFNWVTPALRRIYFEAIPRRMQHPDVDRAAGE